MGEVNKRTTADNRTTGRGKYMERSKNSESRVYLTSQVRSRRRGPIQAAEGLTAFGFVYNNIAASLVGVRFFVAHRFVV